MFSAFIDQANASLDDIISSIKSSVAEAINSACEWGKKWWERFISTRLMTTLKEKAYYPVLSVFAKSLALTVGWSFAVYILISTLDWLVWVLFYGGLWSMALIILKVLAIVLPIYYVIFLLLPNAPSVASVVAD